MIFSYEAKDAQGHRVTGSVEAQDERAAAGQVRDLGYFPMRFAPLQSKPANETWPPPPRRADGVNTGGVNTGNAFPPRLPAMTPGRRLLVRLVYPVWSGVSLRDLALFYRQFAALVNAGVPLYQCLTSLIAQTGNATLRGCLRTMSGVIQSGGMLSDAMAAYPWIFADFHRAMIVAGETTGRLDLMFARLANALEQEYMLRSNIKREMFYPGLTFIASFLLPPLVLLVVNRDAHSYFIKAILPLLEVFGAGLLVYVLTRLASQVKTTYDAVLASLPGIGGAVRMVAMARFSRALASLYAAGVSIPESLRYAAAASGNAYIGGRMLQAIPMLQSGWGIVEALSRTGVFPPMVVSMLGTGEQTGSLDAMMDKVADFFEQESAVRLHQLSVTLGVGVTIFVGIKVAMIVIGFYTGYSSGLGNLLKEPE